MGLLRAVKVVVGFALELGGLLLAMLVPAAAPVAAQTTPPDITPVLLSDVGNGFVVEGDVAGGLGLVTRTYRGPAGTLTIFALPVTDPPGVRALFGVMKPPDPTLDVVAEPSFELGQWFVPKGGTVGDGGTTSMQFASHDAIFIVNLALADPSLLDGPAFVLDVARRQVAAAGGEPSGASPTEAAAAAAGAGLEKYLPIDAPPGFGLGEGVTITGADELKATEGVNPAVVSFLNSHSQTATRVWADGASGLAVGVSVTRYPYAIFAAASLGTLDTVPDISVTSTDGVRGVPHVVVYRGRGERAGQTGTTFRRDDLLVTVLATGGSNTPAARVDALVLDMTRDVASGLPRGATTPYEFPKTPSKIAGLALSGALVSGGAASSSLVAWAQRRRVRRRWHGEALPAPTLPGNGPAGRALALDGDASRLRRQGLVIAVAQLVTINVIVVALAGDFAWAGVAVAAAALIAGLLFTRWWQGHELGLLGAKAPPRELVLPRPAGAVMLGVSLAVLGIGIAYLLKGIRYVALPPTLAQLRWSNWLGLAPRTVGVVFAIGGLAVAMLGATLNRIARALCRAGSARVLATDRRSPALYLRSFDDDSLPLPSIVSARRPLFEALSIRGADPFEESIAWELSSYGPVVAVGRPGRSLASLGAAREHLSDDTWQAEVADRMGRAGLIAVATGETEGLAWELGQLVAGGHLGKTFFVFPPVSPASQARRWDRTAAALARHGVVAGPLPVPATMVHTVRIDDVGALHVTTAARRDEATYRVAVDRIVAANERTARDAPAELA